jgi:uncharacterized repeat protein (TIGR03803 family)
MFGSILRNHSLASALALSAALLAPPGDARAAGFKVLYSFKGGSDGAGPVAGLIADTSGALYGTTLSGGGKCGKSGCGTIFKLDPGGTETVLHAFAGGSDGKFPQAGLAADAKGNLYGTTVYGGGSADCLDGCGTVYKLASGGDETVLYAFTGPGLSGIDGQSPLAGLILDKAGNMYGTTNIGGNGTATGTAFKIAPDGTETVLYIFNFNAQGAALPFAGLVADAAGNLYGTTQRGGSGICDNGHGITCGTVFKLAPNGSETVLYSFTGFEGFGVDQDGEYPQAGLISDKAGNFYGTTPYGGHYDCSSPAQPHGCGIVFKLTADGTETVLHRFMAGDDGANPMAGLVMDKKGNLYGTTYYGGGTGCDNAGCGTIFKIAPDGTETILHALRKKDGIYPMAGLMVDKAGHLFGTTSAGGAHNKGTVFTLKP